MEQARRSVIGNPMVDFPSLSDGAGSLHLYIQPTRLRYHITLLRRVKRACVYACILIIPKLFLTVQELTHSTNRKVGVKKTFKYSEQLRCVVLSFYILHAEQKIFV